ncbi:MAG: preprotein translocase subunit SecE [Verrucomicrobia bacterium]|nr:preprotein translocase subunit SecE [Verrucomicrobiota bacterium]
MKAWYDKIRGFFREVSEEFWKCTRPSAAELKESTVVVVVTMAILGLFIFASDCVISRVLGLAITR